MKLEPRLVPRPLWGRCLRNELGKDRWLEDVSRPVRRAAQGYCEICGDKPDRGPQGWALCCDEVWTYDDNARPRHAKLVDLQAICDQCNSTIHFGFTTNTRPKAVWQVLLARAARLNDVSLSDMRARVVALSDEWTERSRHMWVISWDDWKDILLRKTSALDKAGVASFAKAIQAAKPIAAEAKEITVAQVPAVQAGDAKLSYDVKLTPDQARALAELSLGKNVFLTGGAGVGKSFLIRHWLSKQPVGAVAVTASTGIAATHLDGETINAWTGAELCDKPFDRIIGTRYWQDNVAPRIAAPRALVLEEVSMVDGRSFELYDRLCQQARKDQRPFGGLQLILLGDMGQLSPVRGEEFGFAFETDSWQDADIKLVELTTVMRQQDRIFADLLRQVRNGQVSRSSMALLSNRVKAYDPEEVLDAVRIMTHNARVDEINTQRLESLPGRESQFFAVEAGRQEDLSLLDRSCLSPRMLRLKVGAQVMFTKNGPLYANGTLGRVTKLEAPECIEVQIEGRGVVALERAEWRIEMGADDSGRPLIARRIQFPLRLAYASTVHKIQGCTLNWASVDLYDAFAPGQAYVALSRARVLGGLNIERWAGNQSIITHPIVKQFIEGSYVFPRNLPAKHTIAATTACYSPPPPLPPPTPSPAVVGRMPSAAQEAGDFS